VPRVHGAQNLLIGTLRLLGGSRDFFIHKNLWVNQGRWFGIQIGSVGPPLDSYIYSAFICIDYLPSPIDYFYRLIFNG